MNVRDRSNGSEGSVIQHGPMHLTTSSDKDSGHLIPCGDGGYGSYDPKTPEQVESASEDLSPAEGHLSCPSGPMPEQGHKVEKAQGPATAVVQQPRNGQSNSFKQGTGQRVRTMGEVMQDRREGKPVTANVNEDMGYVKSRQGKDLAQGLGVIAYPGNENGRLGAN